MTTSKGPLPIDDFLPQIEQEFLKHPGMILSASPGAGKTTRVPVALSANVQGQIWVLEPRRVAAIASAHRVAEENGWTLGEEVGYQVRFENQSSPKTKILFLTEALLLRKMRNNPELSQVSAVILDEFHERSVHVDLALGVLKELQEAYRPDLKIVVMSATLHVKELQEYFPGAPLVQVPGRLFPQKIIYQDKAQILRSTPDLIDRMSSLVAQALREQPQGDLLCFLPGRGEIEKVRRQLQSLLKPTVDLLTLHGQMSIPEQRQTLLPARPGQRKVILATNIAESSLTIDGVRLVVDSGLVRQLQMDPRTGFESLQLVRVSKASATQRAGRAARQGPGVVYRAWTTHEESSQRDYDVPEIERVDLSESLLLLAAQGVSHFQKFSWLTAPPARSLQQSLQMLLQLGALDEQNRLTEIGKKLTDIPLHPRIAKLLWAGQTQKASRLACEMAALLSESWNLSSNEFLESENDLFVRWKSFLQQKNKNEHWRRTVDQLQQSLKDTAPPSPDRGSDDDVLEVMNDLLFETYSDRLCRRRTADSPEAKMVGGRGVILHPRSCVKKAQYFLALEVSEGQNTANSTVFAAAALPLSFVEQKILPLTLPWSEIEWDESQKKFWWRSGRQWQGVLVGAVQQRTATAEEIQDRWLQLLRQRWDSFLQKNTKLADWFSRVEFMTQNHPAFEALSDLQIQSALEQGCYGEKSMENLEQKDLVPYFLNTLTSTQRSLLDSEAPTHWMAPTGNRFPIRYSQEQGPSVEIRLQEIFGVPATPQIAGRPLTLFLLAPNYRPVQVTKDLASFWKNAYVDVRKEMRARYPKHSWPEDPLTAAPQAKGRSQKK